MASDDASRSPQQLEALIAAWHEGEVSEAELQSLSELLRGSPEARQLFLEHSQIESDLRWKLSAHPQAQQLIDGDALGNARPVASIVQNEIAFRNDAGFARVFQAVSGSESIAQAWLQVYPRVRAYALFAIGHAPKAEEAVAHVCEELVGRSQPPISEELFLKAIRELTRAACRRVAPGDGGRLQGRMELAEACFDCAESFDAVALSDSFDAYVPRELPSDALQLLCRRYLNGRLPQAIAAETGSTPQQVHRDLAKARLAVWSWCYDHRGSQIDQGDVDHMALASTFFDRADTPPQTTAKLKKWLGDDPRHTTDFATLLVLHEALYRHLSLYRLLDEMTVRRDKALTQQVEIAVRELEGLAALSKPEPAPKPRPAPNTAAWATALAAGLLLALTLVLTRSEKTPATAGVRPAEQVAPTTADPKEEATKREERREEQAPPEPPAPVARVTEALSVVCDPPRDLAAGSELFGAEELTVTEGVLEIATTTGGVWVIEGPARLVLQNDRELTLLDGKLVGLNEGGGPALLVHTPTATLVDRGTEFGVAVQDDQSTTLEVYDGEVTLRGGAQDGAARDGGGLSVEAGYLAQVDPAGGLAGEVRELDHERRFIRTDEVVLRREARGGSQNAAEMVAYFELLRLEGLLAYQGFNEGSIGEELSIGYKSPTIRGTRQVVFGEDLSPNGRAPGKSSVVVAGEQASYYLDLDTGERSTFAKAGMLDPSSKIGASGGELWISWRTKALPPAGTNIRWAGLSLMFGDARMEQEPLFVGKPTSTETLVAQYFKNEIGAGETRQELDFDHTVNGVQPLAIDDREHLWVVRLEYLEAGVELSVWCDPDPAGLPGARANARESLKALAFDRVRLEVASNNPASAWAFDDVLFARNLNALQTAIGLKEAIRGDKADGGSPF